MAEVQRVRQLQETVHALDRPDTFISMEDFSKAVNIANIEDARKPENVSVAIADELCQNDITPAKWKEATPVQRIDMMDQAFDIMLEKMNVPKSLKVAFDHVGTKENVAGECNLFVKNNPDGSIVLDKTVQPRVSMNYELMYVEDIQTVLNSIFHQASLVMQQVSCTNPPIARIHPDWVEEITSEIKGIRAGAEGAMQKYIRNAEVVFEKKYDGIVAANKIRNSQVSFK